jgi:4-hydroxy-tetrahydrodipicolinate synthase
MVRAAEAAGADWLILQPPAAGSYGAGEYLDFFGRVMDATALPVAIQNAPQYLGRGLAADDIARLMRRHANMTLIKAEGSAVEVERLIAATEGRLQVFNGRGGLELLDSLHAGCSGFLLAPDAVDHAVAILRLHAAGDEDAAAAAYARVAPSIVFVMQSIETLICYGKRLAATRLGLAVHDRAPALRPTDFGLELVARHAAALGPFGQSPFDNGPGAAV